MLHLSTSFVTFTASNVVVFFKFTSSVIAGVGIIDKMQMLHSLGYR